MSTIPDGILAGIFVIALVLSTWICIIIYERLEHPKPKPPPMVEYDGPEPIGFDLNHKDWDDPQWEAPPWQYRSNMILHYNDILTANEFRTLNLEHMIIESQLLPHAILSSKGMEVKVLQCRGCLGLTDLHLYEDCKSKNIERVTPYPSEYDKF